MSTRRCAFLNSYIRRFDGPFSKSNLSFYFPFFFLLAASLTPTLLYAEALSSSLSAVKDQSYQGINGNKQGLKAYSGVNSPGSSPQNISEKIDTVVINVILNGEPKGELFLKITTDGDFLIKRDDLSTMGFTAPAGEVWSVEDEVYLSLRSMQGVNFVFNERDLSLEIKASPELLPKREIDFMASRHLNIYFPKENSAFLNYKLTHSDGDTAIETEQMTNQLGIRLADILFMSDSSYTRTPEEEKFVRLMSSATYDRPEQMQRFVLGDQFAASGELGSSVNMGGIGFAKIYKMNPYFMKNPTLTVSGLISLPSEVEVYLNGVRIKREKLSPGEFELKNLSYYGGAGDVEIIIRDAFGREERIRHPYYFTDILLKKGLHEYSYNIGAMRKDYGIESDIYGNTAYSFYHRYGLSDSITVGLRGEGLTGEVFNIGPQVSYNINNYGVAILSLSESSGSRGHDGSAWSLNYGYYGRRFGVSLLTRMYTEDYSTIVSINSRDKLKAEYGIGISYSIEDMGNISMNYSATKIYSGTDRQVTTLAYSKMLSKWIQGILTYRNMLEEETNNEIFAGLNFNTDDLSAAINYRKSKDDATTLLQAQKNLPLGEGFGYRATVENRETRSHSNYKVDPVVQYNARHGLLEGEYIGNYDGHTSERNDYYQLSLSGSIVYVGRTFGLTRPVSDSFGLVQTGDLKDVKILLGGQEIGKSDSRGMIFLTNLNSYYDNQVSINDKEISMDYSMPEVTQYVSPPLRSGSCIVFGITKIQYITGRLKVAVGEKIVPVEFYEVRMNVDGKEVVFPTGRDGEFFFETVLEGQKMERRGCSSIDREGGEYQAIRPGSYKASFTFRGKEHIFDLVIPASDEAMIDIGEVRTPFADVGMPLPAKVSHEEGGIATEPVSAPVATAPMETVPSVPHQPGHETLPAATIEAQPLPKADREVISPSVMTAPVPPPPLPMATGPVGSPIELQPAGRVMRDGVECVVPEDSRSGQSVTVHFPFDRSIPVPKCGSDIVNDVISLLKKYRELVVELEGHCDQIGSDRYNMVLGMKRAEDVRKRLINSEIDRGRITKVTSMGKRQPVCNTLDENCRKRNRRVVIRISSEVKD